MNENPRENIHNAHNRCNETKQNKNINKGENTLRDASPSNTK